jgi:hypothetical protein
MAQARELSNNSAAGTPVELVRQEDHVREEHDHDEHAHASGSWPWRLAWSGFGYGSRFPTSASSELPVR